jgi:phosphoserine phosphatase
LGHISEIENIEPQHKNAILTVVGKQICALGLSMSNIFLHSQDNKGWRKLIVVFDVEGVLIDGELLPSLARLVGKEEEVKKLTLMGIRGEIDWEEGLRRRLKLLRGISYEECKKVAESLPFTEGAHQMVEELRRIGAILIGVSGGFSILTSRVKSQLELDHVFSNELVFHSNKLIGYGLLVNSNKTQILKTAFDDFLEHEPKVAVVDGANDLDLFKIADLKIAFNAQPIVKQRADVIIDRKDLREVSKTIREYIEAGKLAPERRSSTKTTEAE